MLRVRLYDRVPRPRFKRGLCETRSVNEGSERFQRFRAGKKRSVKNDSSLLLELFSRLDRTSRSSIFLVEWLEGASEFSPFPTKRKRWGERERERGGGQGRSSREAFEDRFSHRLACPHVISGFLTFLFVRLFVRFFFFSLPLFFLFCLLFRTSDPSKKPIYSQCANPSSRHVEISWEL